MYEYESICHFKRVQVIQVVRHRFSVIFSAFISLNSEMKYTPSL